MKEYTLHELNDLLNNGTLTSEQLVKDYLERICKYDWLKAVGEINRNVISEAKALDIERKTKGPRSILHGIPIVLKDNINVTGPMHTSAGSKSLENVFAPYDATLTKKLKDAGMIILGKANLSEFAYFMSTAMPCGFSSKFGQCVSPYDPEIDPLGSSTGSAVAVAANLIPVSIGSETNGSLMAPAHMNSIVSIKPTLGMVSRYGILPISASQDTAGPMSRTVEDSAILMDYLYGKDENDIETQLIPEIEYHFEEAIHQPLQAKRLGFVSFKGEPYDKEHIDCMNHTKEVFKSLGVECVDIEFEYPDIENVECLLHEFKKDLNYYLSTLGTASDIKTLKDIIEINKTDPDAYMPYNQELLELAEKRSGYLTEPVYLNAKKTQLQQASELIEKIDAYQVDAIVSMERFPHGAILGTPTVTVPAKALTDTTPISIVIGAKKWEDDKILNIAYYYEQATKFRLPPNLDKERKDVEHASKFWDVTDRK